MEIRSDIEIAQSYKMQHILEIAKRAGIKPEYVEQYGNFKAKLDYGRIMKEREGRRGKLILVTAITPTPAGEGKNPPLLKRGQE